MPKRSPPPDRLAAEAALSTDERDMLWAQAVVLGIPSDRWHKAPILANAWGTYAAVKIAKDLQVQNEGLSEDRALSLGAGKIGLNGETVRTRLRSCYRDVYRPIPGV